MEFSGNEKIMSLTPNGSITRGKESLLPAVTKLFIPPLLLLTYTFATNRIFVYVYKQKGFIGGIDIRSTSLS